MLLLALLATPFFSTHSTSANFVVSTSPTLTPLKKDAATALIARSSLISPMNAQQMLSLGIVLSLNHVDELQQYIQAVYTPGSYLYHHYLQPATFTARYALSPQDIQRVVAYAQSQGFSVVHANSTIIDVTASVATVERAFHVQINTYKARNGRLFYANTNTPLVPQNLQPLIQHISGLSDALQRHHSLVRTQLLAGNSASHATNTSTCPGIGGNYFLPSQLANAYDFKSLYNAGYHGEGQNVALFELDGSTPGDISGYQQCFAVNSPSHLTTTLIDGGPGSTGAGGLEVDLDVDVLLGMLPGLSNLSLYEAPNTDTGYNDTWARILKDDIPIVSTSWGTCEQNLSASNIAAEEQFFLQAAAQGQSIIAASGDNAAYDCGDGTLAVDDPASNPYVTGVGGTSLTLNSDSSYHGESTWSNTSSSGYGSGGGISKLWSMPAYERGTGVISANSSGTPCHAASGVYCREVPDVSFNADPNTGYIVYCTVVAAGCQPSSPFVHVGGTSAAAPMWAALIALTNQYALAHGGNNLGFLNPTLYALFNSNTLASTTFHDIITGSNTYYPTTTGYDMTTGIGSYDAYNFAHAVLSLSSAHAVPGNTQWYFPEGHVGNHFQEYVTLENPNAVGIAHITIHYLLRGKAPLSEALTLSASSRTTANANVFLGVDRLSSVGQDVSLYITSDIPIVVERPIYFTFGGVTPGGSNIIGSTRLGQHFVFANGSTQTGYSTFLSILNPMNQPLATVTASYYSGGTQIGQTTITVPAGQRNTIPLGAVLPIGKQFLIKVDADQPIAVERPLYVHTSVAGIPGVVVGGGSVAGVVPATDWYFPNGYTGSQDAPSQENILLANADINGSGAAANVTVTYAFTNGSTKTVNITVPARSQVIRSVNTDVGSGMLVAMKVHSNNGIVAERQQFFSLTALTPNSTEVEVVGTTTGAQGLSTIYSFAEGHLGSSFSELVTVFNPNSSSIHVAITYLVTNGTRQYLAQQQVNIPAMGVVQVNANTFLNVPNWATTASGVAVDTSLIVQSLQGNGGTILPLVAERSLYFNFQGSMAGETSVVGYGG